MKAMMKTKHLLPAMAAIALAPVHAQSSVTLYGVLDVGLYGKQLSGQDRSKGVESGLMETSFFGLKGSEDLGQGLRANFDLASFIRMDSGESTRGAPSEGFWSKYAWVGLTDARWGALRLGRISTPNFISTMRYNPFGPSPVFNTSFAHNYVASAVQPMTTGSGATDSGWSNSLAYTSPSFGGLVLALQASPSEGGTAGRRIGYAVTYAAGEFAATLSGDQTRNAALSFPLAIPSLPGAVPPFTGRDFSTWQFGSSYDFKWLKLFGQYAHTDIDGSRPGPVPAQEIALRSMQLGLSAPIGSGKLLLSAARTTLERSTATDQTRSTLTLGYTHDLSKRTELYAVLMSDKVTQLDRGTGYAAGIRHRF